jgi:phage-related minor tail protein
MEQPVETWTVRVDADVSGLQEQLNAASGAGRQFSRSLITAFQGVAIQGKGITETLRTFALSLSQMTLQAAFRPLDQIASNALQGLLSGGVSAGGGGMPLPFASGGVISSPIAFPMQGGATGIAGERGAEAIMPLARGPDGKLGVRADSGSRDVSITLNVTTPDAESFRRTETQLSAMLARAVANGQRNM